jgi:hypothetical protein
MKEKKVRLSKDNRMPKYTIEGVKEDEIFNKYLNHLGTQKIAEMLALKLRIPEGYLRYNAQIRHQGLDTLLGIYAPDELGAWSRVPAEIKRQWDMFRKKDRYGRPKWKT